MMKFYALVILSLLIFNLRAQVDHLSVDGTVTVQPDALIFVQGNVNIKSNGILDIQSSGASHGKVQVNYQPVGAQGTWRCDGTTQSTNTATSTLDGDGEVYFLGDVDYEVKGIHAAFPNLIVDVGSGNMTGGANVAKLNLVDSINVMRSLDLKYGRIVTNPSNGTNFPIGQVVYISNSAPGAIKSSVTGAGFGKYYSNFIEGSLRREIAVGNYYKFPVGSTPDPVSTIKKKGYNPAFIDLSVAGARKPSNATSIVAKFEDFPDPGVIHYNDLASTCYSTSTHYQFLELFWMIKQFGYWDLKPNGNPAGWWYTFYCKPDINYIFSYNHGLTHIKVIKAPRTFTPLYNADWTQYVNESGNGCDMVNVYTDINGHTDIYWKPGPNTSTYPYDLTDSIRASELTTFSRFGLGAGAGAGLPIELLYLEAHPVDNSYIQVDWATATEINNSGFEVQRSTDGVNFTQIGWRDGAGNSSSTLTYGFPDHDVVPNKLYYYRLKQIDYNGTSDSTYVVSAMIVSSSTFTISEFIPNPTENQSRIEFVTSAEKDINVTVYSTLGQIIAKSDYHLVTGTNTIDFDFNLLANGTYFAIIQADNEIYNRKLILTK